MERYGRGTIEFLERPRLLISYFPFQQFTDLEWDGYVSAVKRFVGTPGFRVLSWSAGATPSPEQQFRMRDVALGSTHKVALVAPAATHGFAVSLMHLTNRNVRTFGETELTKVYEHLELSQQEQSEVSAALESIRQLG